MTRNMARMDTNAIHMIAWLAERVWSDLKLCYVQSMYTASVAETGPVWHAINTLVLLELQ